MEVRSAPRRPQLLAVCGSLQHRSANRAALDVVVEAARAADAGVDVFSELAGIPAFDPDRDGESIPALDDWLARIAAADAVVVAAPEYAGGVAGAVKNAFDWLVGRGGMYRRPAAVVSAGTSGGVFAREALVRTLTWQGAHVVADVGIAFPRTKSDGAGRIVDPAALDELRALTATVLAATSMSADDRLALVAGVTDAVRHRRRPHRARELTREPVADAARTSAQRRRPTDTS